MKYCLCSKKGYENTTIRNLRDQDNAVYGVIGTVADLLEYKVFNYCDQAPDKWAAICGDDQKPGKAYFAETKEKAIDILIKNHET